MGSTHHTPSSQGSGIFPEREREDFKRERERDDDNIKGNVFWAQATQYKESYTDLILVENDV